MDVKTELLHRLQKAIDRVSPVPLYHQLEKTVEEIIETGLLLPGEKLPGDLQLSGLLDVDHRTVRKAFSGLVAKGWIKRIKRAGTFVTEKAQPVLPAIGFFYFAEAEYRMIKRAEHAQRRLALHNFDAKIIGFDADYYEKVNLCREVKRKGLKGAIMVPLLNEACRNNLKSLEEKRFPYVRLGNSFFTGELKAPLVRGNEKKNILDAILHLREHGHERIGLVCNQHGNEIAEGHANYFTRSGGFPAKWVMGVEFSGPPEHWERFPGRRMIAEYLAKNPDLTAIVVENPCVCIELVKAAKAMGKDVPSELSVICLCDWEGLDAFSPAITAMYLSEKEMGENAAQALLQVIQSGPKKTEEIISVDYRLIERESVNAVMRAGETVCEGG